MNLHEDTELPGLAYRPVPDAKQVAKSMELVLGAVRKVEGEDRKYYRAYIVVFRRGTHASLLDRSRPDSKQIMR